MSQGLDDHDNGEGHEIVPSWPDVVEQPGAELLKPESVSHIAVLAWGPVPSSGQRQKTEGLEGIVRF